MEHADVADFHETVRETLLAEPAEKRQGVEGGGSSACTAEGTIGAGDATRLARNAAAIGDGDPEAIGGEVVERCGPMWRGLAVDVPRHRPGLWVDVLQPAGLAQVFFEESAGEGGEGCDGDKEVGSGRQPTTAVLRQSPAGDHGVEVGVVRELSAPGMQDTEKARAVGAQETLVFGEPCEGLRRGLAHGLGGAALLGAEKGTQGLRAREGDEAVRPGKRWLQVVGEPLLGCLLLPRGPVAVATGLMDAVWRATALALREAVSLVAAWAVLDGADDLAVRGGEVGLTRQGLWRTGGAAIAAGGHGRSPGRRELRRS
jgi:hypothetical protein